MDSNILRRQFTSKAQQFRQRLLGGSFRANVILLVSGASVGQFLVVVAAPIISRLYSPEDFGVVTVFTFLFTVLLTVNSLRYEFAIPLPEEDADAVNLVGLCLTLVSITTILFGFFVWVGADSIVSLTNAAELKSLLWLLPVILLITGAVMTINYWSYRKKRFAPVTGSQLAYNLTLVTSQIGAGLAYWGPIGLVTGQIAGQIAALTVLFRGAKIPWKTLQPRKWMPLIIRFKNFPLFSAWSSLIDAVGLYIPGVLLVILFSLEAGGFLSMTMRVVRVPFNLINYAFTQSFYPAIAEKQNDPVASRRLVEQLASVLLIIATPIFLLLMLNGPYLFGTILGDRWTEAGIYAQYLAPAMLTSFLFSPLSSISLVKNQQRGILFYSILITVLRVLLMLIGAVFQSVDLSLILYSLVSVIVEIVYLQWLFHLLGSSLLAWFTHVRLFVAVVGVSFLALIIINSLMQSIPIVILNALVLGGIGIYFLRKSVHFSA